MISQNIKREIKSMTKSSFLILNFGYLRAWNLSICRLLSRKSVTWDIL